MRGQETFPCPAPAAGSREFSWLGSCLVPRAGENDAEPFFAGQILFLLIVVGHLMRIIFVWRARIGAWDVPMWISRVAVVVLGDLAFTGFRLGAKSS